MLKISLIFKVFAASRFVGATKLLPNTKQTVQQFSENLPNCGDDVAKAGNYRGDDENSVDNLAARLKPSTPRI
ncbi:MAG: hypothetical protein ACC619_03655, partial [Paracoccaceae bacterium]